MAKSKAHQSPTPKPSTEMPDPMIEQSVVDGTGLGPGEAASATEIWWRTFTLTSREAAAGGPVDYSNCGEEDPGSGLEFLVGRTERR